MELDMQTQARITVDGRMTISVRVSPWTKESLVELGARAQGRVAEEARLAFVAGEPDRAREWGTRLPRIQSAIDRARTLPYETGAEADEIGALLSRMMGSDPLPTEPSPPCARCGRATKHSGHASRDLEPCCSAFCASEGGAIYEAHRASVTGITRALLAATEDIIPFGILPRDAIALVADHLGIGVDPADLPRR